MNYTSIEQSKKLLELGLNPESADMSWAKITHDLKEEFSWEVFLGPNPAIKMNTFSFRNGYVLPCWSVGALLEVMPPYLFEWEKGIDLEIYPALNKSRWQVSYISRDMSPENNDRYTKIMFGDTLIEAAYNMVVWLLENNYIKHQ